MKPIKEFLTNHQNIAKIFPDLWFESELEKPHEERHLPAKQFSFEDTPYHNSISDHEFTHLETNLGFLQKEIQTKGSISKNLKNTAEYTNIIGQIEIAALFKKMGFKIELEPHIPDSKKKADIKLITDDLTIFIEVRTLHDREGTQISKSDYVEIRTIKNHSTPTIKEIITEKTQQLSEHHPGILVINLDKISRTLHFEGGFYECSRDCPNISGMILYHHYFNNEGCRVIIDYFANPYAKIPLPNPIERLLEKGGITISTWPEKDIALIEEIKGKNQ